MSGNAPVLQDLAYQDFTEGDYVVYSSVNGIRFGKVDWIKDVTSPYPGALKEYKVYVSLEEQRSLPANAPGKMYAKRVGYTYHPRHFLKIEKSPLS